MVRSSAEARLAMAARRHCAYIKVVVEPSTKRRQRVRRTKALAKLVPFYYEEFASMALERAVKAAAEEWPPDLVQAEWIGSVRYLDSFILRSVPTIYSAHNLEHLVVAGPPKGWRRIMAYPFARNMARIERGWAARVMGVTALSQKETKWFNSINPNSYYIPNAVSAEEYPFLSPSSRKGGPVGFIGHLGYPPNRAAAITLARHVFPSIKAQRPGQMYVIAGRSPDSDLLAFAEKNVSILGDLENMADIWSRISLLLCPLTWGAGSRVKLLEAAASGVPVVATPISAEGLAFEPDRDYLAVDSPKEMVEKALALLADPVRADGLAQRARETLMAEHDWETIRPNIAGLYEDLLPNGPKGTQGGCV
jgi:glycosyltransferase involved in cell wall biosynthesis